MTDQRPVSENGTQAGRAKAGGRLGPEQRRRLWQRLRHPAWLGTLRRLTPLSDSWGYDRGTPLDRYYIEGFLAQFRQDIRGRVLELRDGTYANQFGTGVERLDVLDINPSNAQATIVADLAAADGVPSNQFDCILLTQTLQFIYDLHAALNHIQRILRPGGVLLATVPSVSRIAPRYGLKTDYWRFTAASCSALFGAVFGQGQVTIQSCGNVLTAVAFMTGMSQEELSRSELDTNDPYFPLIIAIRAVKPVGAGDSLMAGRADTVSHG